MTQGRCWVSTFVYMPYCIFNIVSPLMSLCVAASGWKIKRPHLLPAADNDYGNG